MPRQLDTWREYLVDLVLEDNNYTEILQEYQLGVIESADSYTAYGLGDAILDINNDAQIDASRNSAIADAESMLKYYLQNNEVQLTNAIVNEIQYNLTSESSHIVYVVYTIDKTNIIYPSTETPVVEVVEETPVVEVVEETPVVEVVEETPVVEKSNKKKSTKIKTNIVKNTEFKIEHENFNNKFKLDDNDKLHILIDDKFWVDLHKQLEIFNSDKLTGISDELLIEYKQRIQNVLDVVSECDTLNKIKTI